MYFYFVKKGDNLYSIAKKFNVDVNSIIKLNDIENPNELSVNQCILIKLNPIKYRVQKGDTLTKIAKMFNTNINSILSWNKGLTDELKINQEILILYEETNKKNIIVNAYCYESIKLDILLKSFKYLTFLSIFSYKVNENGYLSNINDEQIIELALKNNVKPIMVITNSKENGGFSPSIASAILNSKEKKERLIQNIYQILRRKKYYGLCIDFEYIKEEDKNQYENFISEIKQNLSEKGYYISVALAPKNSSKQEGLLYKAHDYNILGKYVDNVILMTYEWGYLYSESMPISPVNKVEEVLQYGIKNIDSKKILMGIANYSYDYFVPKEEGKTKAISIKNASNLAYQVKAEIQYNQISKTPYYIYYKNEKKHEVQFDNAFSFFEKLKLIYKYNLSGISIWTITTYNKPLFEIIDYYFQVKKIN